MPSVRPRNRPGFLQKPKGFQRNAIGPNQTPTGDRRRENKYRATRFKSQNGLGRIPCFCFRPITEDNRLEERPSLLERRSTHEKGTRTTRTNSTTTPTDSCLRRRQGTPLLTPPLGGGPRVCVRLRVPGMELERHITCPDRFFTRTLGFPASSISRAHPNAGP